MKDRVWVRNSESDETNNYEVVKSKEPENLQCGSFKCKNLDGGGDGELVVDFHKHQWGYYTPPIRETRSPPFYGFPPELPPRPRRNSSRSRERMVGVNVIQRTNSFSQ